MGLDMYLHATKSISNFKFEVERRGESEEFDSIVRACNAYDIITDDSPFVTVTFTAMYWRKANAIHQWFVDNCQGGVDECQRGYVAREQLVELLNICRKVALEPATAGDVLPTQGGFFFGSTEYDEWYHSDIKRTITGLERVLAEVPDDYSWSFYYQSSW